MSRSEAAQGSANSPVLTAARAYARAGISVVPIRVDGSKQPAVVWKSYQSTYPLADEVDDWFDNGQYGIGLVCGHISGGLEVLDCEDPTAFDQWRALVEARAPGLIARLPVVATPRPGRHVYYRSASVEGNQKLARGADGRTLIETRGEGGYVIAPGSAAACHPTGRTYEHVGGPPLTEIPLITAEERAALLAIARSFDHREIDSCKDDQLGATAQEWPAAAPGSTEPLPNVLNRATGYLRACDPAISGQGGHNQTFKVTCRLLHGFHLDDEMAFSLLLNHYNPRCVLPWSERELRHKVESARTQGSYHDMLNHPNSVRHEIWRQCIESD